VTCLLEKQLAGLLVAAGLAFTIPERDRNDPTTLDFYVVELDLYIEVKQFATPRIAAQLAKVPEHKTAIVLQGPNAVTDFALLCRLISDGREAQ
jgi:hypothetical protein